MSRRVEAIELRQAAHKTLPTRKVIRSLCPAAKAAFRDRAFRLSAATVIPEHKLLPEAGIKDPALTSSHIAIEFANCREQAAGKKISIQIMSGYRARANTITNAKKGVL